MKRHVAGTLLGVLGFFITDSHIDWVRHDDRLLMEINGLPVDAQGWVAERWRQLHPDCGAVRTEAIGSPAAQAVLHTIEQHSPPDSLNAQLLQLHRQADWAVAEVGFQTLNPSIVVLQQVQGHWRILDGAVWSGSTSPWLPADFVRRYLQQQAPQMPEALRVCVPIDAQRYATTATRPRARPGTGVGA
jgi:hypothetical protein